MVFIGIWMPPSAAMDLPRLPSAESRSDSDCSLEAASAYIRRAISVAAIVREPCGFGELLAAIYYAK